MGIRIDDPAIEKRGKSSQYRGFEQLSNVEGKLVSATGENPFCGDELEVRVVLRLEKSGWVVVRAVFDGYGCTLCLAAADAVMEWATARPVCEACRLAHDDVCALLGGLEVGRTRKGCVDLAANVLKRALEPMVQ